MLMPAFAPALIVDGVGLGVAERVPFDKDEEEGLAEAEAEEVVSQVPYLDWHPLVQ